MPIAIDSYFQFQITGAVTDWANTFGEPDMWMIVVHMASSGTLSDMGGDPAAGFGWPPGSFQLLAQADAGTGLPKIRVWAVLFFDSVPRTFRIGSDIAGIDHHSHTYFLTGLRPGTDASDVFMAGVAESTSSGAGTSQTVPLYAPESGDLLIGAWISGAVANYTSLGGPTAEAELDSTSATSRTGEETLSAAGPGSRTATASVSAAWAATAIAVRPDTGAPVTFPAQPLTMKTELALGANPGQDPAYWAGLWTDITDDSQPRDGGVAIKRGRADETSTVGPSSMTLTLDNTAGKYVRLNALGPYYGLLQKNTPIQLWVDVGDGWRLRYRGFISEFPPRSQGGQVDEHMPIEANGPTRRLARGKVFASPLFRAVTAHGIIRTTPYFYWPLETGPSSGVLGGTAMRLTGPVNFSTDGPVGSAGEAEFALGTKATAPIVGMGSTSSWQVSFWLEIPADSVDSSPIVGWVTPGAIYSEWFAYVNSGQPGKVAVEVFNPGVDEVFIIGTQDIRGMGPVLVTVRANQQVGQVYISLSINLVRASADFTFATSDFVFPVTSIGINNLNGLDADHGVTSLRGSISHPYVTPETAANDEDLQAQLAWLLAAGQGYAGERACDRIRRLANEENVPVVIVGDDGDSEPMGPQPIDRFLTILRDVEAVDGGVLYERRDARLAYQARAGRYNATPALIMDYAAGHVAPPLEPNDDDRYTLNEYTASRDGGSSARVLDAAHRDAVGEYADGNTLNVAADAQLVHQAGWRVHRGTADDLRYPVVVPNLNATPALIPDWAALDVGMAAAIANPGRDLPSGQIDMIVEGYGEVIDTVSWTAAPNCSPGKPWQVVVLGHDTLGRADTAGSILAASLALPAATSSVIEDFEDATLAVTITGGGNLPWARSAARSHTGAWSLKSGAITDNQTSDAIITVPVGKTHCTFWYRVSSEATFDFLHVLVDAVEQFAVSGESAGWQHGAVVVTGASTVTFRYTKDAFTAGGDDAAYLDDVVFTTAEAISVATKSGPLWTTDTGDMPFDITAAGEEMTVLANTAQVTLNSDPGFVSGAAWAASGGTFTATGVGQLTPNGSSGTVQVFSTPKVAVVAGHGYTATALLQNNATRSVNFIVNWYNASNVLVSSSSLAVALTANVLASVARNLVAPATATQAEIGVTMTGTPPVGHVLFLDEMRLVSTHTMTVARAVNGIAKAHSLGEDVRLAAPPILSL